MILVEYHVDFIEDFLQSRFHLIHFAAWTIIRTLIFLARQYQPNSQNHATYECDQVVMGRNFDYHE